MAYSKVIPFSKIKKIDIINVQGGITASEVMSKYKPDILMNLALYDTDTSTNMTFLEDENKKSGSYFSLEGIGIKRNKTLVWCNKEEAFSSDEIRDYVSGSPILIKDGKKNIDWGNLYSSYVDGKHVRSCVGFNSNSLILVASSGSITLEDMANHCLSSYYPTYMINCDGGGSCHLQDTSTVYVKSYRANVSWLLVYLMPEPKTMSVSEATIYLDKEEMNGIIVNGSTYAPVRKLCESLGKTVDFVNGEIFVK